MGTSPSGNPVKAIVQVCRDMLNKAVGLGPATLVATSYMVVMLLLGILASVRALSESALSILGAFGLLGLIVFLHHERASATKRQQDATEVVAKEIEAGQNQRRAHRDQLPPPPPSQLRLDLPAQRPPRKREHGDGSV